MYFTLAYTSIYLLKKLLTRENNFCKHTTEYVITVNRKIHIRIIYAWHIIAQSSNLIFLRYFVYKLVPNFEMGNKKCTQT